MIDLTTQNYINHKNSGALINMVKGIEPMINKAPDNDKKEMLLDVIRFSKECAESLRIQTNSFSFINTDNLQLEIKLTQEKTKAVGELLKYKKLEIENKKLKDQIKLLLEE